MKNICFFCCDFFRLLCCVFNDGDKLCLLFLKCEPAVRTNHQLLDTAGHFTYGRWNLSIVAERKVVTPQSKIIESIMIISVYNEEHVIH